MSQEDERRAQQIQRNARDEPAGEARPPATEVDRLALDGTKSEWMDATDSPASALPDAEELRGIDLLGRRDVRDGAIEGVGGGSGLENETHSVGRRRNPPQVDAVDGDQSGTSGGRAGGAGE